MSKRFADRSDVRELIKSSEDFKVRSYGSYIVWVCISLIIMSLAVKFHFDNMSDNILLGEDNISIDNILVGVILIVVASMIVGGYLLLNIFKLRSIIDAIEFQSIIFSSSMRAHSLFSFIVNKNHTVIYMDKEASEVFAVEPASSLEGILISNVLSEENRERIIKAVSKGKSDEITMAYKDSKGKSKDVIITIDALSKPAGYFAIRGYGLKDKRV